MFIQTVGLFLALGTIISAYIVRYNADKGKFTHGHMGYIIKSFWISSLFLAIGILASFFLADHTIIENTVDSVNSGAFVTEAEVQLIMMDYARANFFVFTMAFAPSILYMLYRLVKGMIKAKAYDDITNPKSWL